MKIFRLEEKFLWLDWVEETAPLLAALDVFVSASHTESFGLAILEAMNAGCAVVSTETEGAKELLDEKTGKLVPVKDAVALAGAIGEFLEDENLRITLGENSQKKARAEFSLEKMINQTVELYFKSS